MSKWTISERVQRGIVFATEMHGTQARKGTTIPYIVHPMSVCKLLIRHGAGDDLAIAGVLHDVVEDTPATEEQVQELFGERVKELVVHASEPDKDADWRTRKQHTIESARAYTDIELLALKCADKLDNLSDIRFDYSQAGEEFWQRFNSPKGKVDQDWYYGELSKLFTEKLGPTTWSGLAEEMASQHRAVFG